MMKGGKGVKDMRFLNGIRGTVRLPSMGRPLINNGRRIGRNILNATEGYEEQVYDVISRRQLPRIEVYPNSGYKTAIYRASETSPCIDDIFYKCENLLPYGKEYWFAIFTAMDKRRTPCSSFPLSAGGLPHVRRQRRVIRRQHGRRHCAHRRVRLVLRR